jgi:pimeloyl-ACP methyl ester carboxylesterase
MTLQQQRFHLPTGVELDVTLGGPQGAEALIFLHGFPESHRTWRHQLAALCDDYFVAAPDQRGYAGSSKPPRQEDYEPSRPVADLIALADALELERFTLVGHDWGGAIAWLAALKHPDRIARLVIANAPHPFLFQRTLIDDPEQRAASQYIRTFRDPAFETKLGGDGSREILRGQLHAHGRRAIAERGGTGGLPRPVADARRVHRDAQLVPRLVDHRSRDR